MYQGRVSYVVTDAFVATARKWREVARQRANCLEQEATAAHRNAFSSFSSGLGGQCSPSFPWGA